MSRPHRNLARFLAGRLLATVAFQIQSVAVGLQVYRATHDAMDLAWVGLVQFLPLLVFSPYAGTVADRHDRRRIVATTSGVFALGALALAALVLSPGADRLGVAPILGVLALLGATRAFSAPATWALLPWLVPRDQLPRAIPMSSAIYQLATIGGPALGGLLYALGGAELAYVASAVTSGGAAVLFLTLRPDRPPRAASAETGWQRVLGGLAFLRSQRALLGAISLDLAAVLLGGAVALMPIFAEDILQVDELGFGLLRAGPAIGAAAMALILARYPLRRRAGAWMFGGVAVFGLATIGFGLSERFALSVGLLVILGAADMISVVVRQSIIQLGTPDELRGRVASLNMMFIGASNELGEFESGLTTKWLGSAVRATVLGGVGTLIVTGLWAAWFGELRRVDSLDEVGEG